MFTLTIKTENAAFEGDDLCPTLGAIIGTCADRVENGTLEGVLHDPNGNMVARFEYTPEARQDRDSLEALRELQKQLRAHIRLDVKKHYSLMVADAAASKVIARATE